ncbi:hypothetical protein HYW76_01535 [Candidatus Pacearchaeota archaeon]|nr:hypothetical protein [Candidatus Pacearchaeota archaeon]
MKEREKNKGLEVILIIVVLVIVSIAGMIFFNKMSGKDVAPLPCTNNQVIFKLSGNDNAHASDLNGLDSIYANERRYNDLFGGCFVGASPNDCQDYDEDNVNDNVVVRLSEQDAIITNSHGEGPKDATTETQDSYTDICYGSLECDLFSGGCPTGKTFVVKMSGETNAHFSFSGANADYPFSLCCSVGIVCDADQERCGDICCGNGQICNDDDECENEDPDPCAQFDILTCPTPAVGSQLWNDIQEYLREYRGNDDINCINAASDDTNALCNCRCLNSGGVCSSAFDRCASPTGPSVPPTSTPSTSFSCFVQGLQRDEGLSTDEYTWYNFTQYIVKGDGVVLSIGECEGEARQTFSCANWIRIDDTRGRCVSSGETCSGIEGKTCDTITYKVPKVSSSPIGFFGWFNFVIVASGMIIFYLWRNFKIKKEKNEI